MQIRILCFGKMDKNGYESLQNWYQKKLACFCDLKIIELKEEITNDLEKNQKRNEENLARLLPNNNNCFLLDSRGKQFGSEDFAMKLNNLNTSANVEVTFIIGPSDGFSRTFQDKMANKISFGLATLPHQLARVVILEQIYRSFKINNNEKYHK